MNTTAYTFTNGTDAAAFARSQGGPIEVDVEHVARGQWVVTVTAQDAPRAAAAHRAEAAAHRAEAARSFEDCDTDGFVSQWASGISARLADRRAEIAEAGGTAEFDALFLLDGTVASTHAKEGEYGEYWVLNDHAAEVLGRRFITTSNASKGATRMANNRKKGITRGTIRCAAYADTAAPANATGLAGAMSVYIAVYPVVTDLREGRYEVVTTERDLTDY